MRSSNEFLFLSLLVLGCSTAAQERLVPGSSAEAPGLGGAGSAGGDARGGSAGSSQGAASGAGETAGAGGGTAGGHSGSAGMMGKHGVQADPGSEGDGVFDQPAPYPAPVETLQRAAGAPVGSISAANLFDSGGVYPGLKFQYWIYVPAQYQPGKPAALMVFLDGVHYLGLSEAKFNSLIALDNLIHSGEMPVTIALFIQPGTNDGVYSYPGEEQSLRSMQYDTPTDTYADFLLDEIIPGVIASSYDIVEDPDGWAIGGHSSGGICAFMVGWYRENQFRKLLTHNASFPNTDGVFPASIGAADPKPLRVYLLSSPNDIAGWFPANTEAARILEEKGYHVRYRQGTGEHFPPAQAVADYAEALRWIWRGYTLPWY